MLIKSKLHRNGGTQIHFGKGRDTVHYHFLPLDPKAKRDDPAIDHVCDVTDAKHVAALLAIPEGYEVHESAIGAKKAAPADPANESSDEESNEKVDYTEMSNAELKAAYKAKFGKGVKPGMTAAKIIEALSAE